MGYNRKHFSTHVKALSKRFNLEIVNIMYYAKNNNLSPRMTTRLINKYKDDCEEHLCQKQHQN